MAMIKGRQQFTCRQIAGGAKDNQIKWINRDQDSSPSNSEFM
jgi:hypothetical protein